METASFNGFLRTLFYIVVFYYIFKFLAKLFFPILMRKVVEKAGENFQKQQDQFRQSQQNQSANTASSTSDKASSKPKETKKVGEYVDFEEIE